MRRESLTVLAAAAMALAASAASAADLPRKAPPAYIPPAPPPITWTGCYIGANIGWVGGHVKAEFNVGNNFFNNNFNDNHSNNSGFAGGGQIGCDYQFAGGWVIGFRNMFDGTSQRRDRDLGFVNNSFEGVQLQLQKSMVRHPDGPPRLFLGTRLVALRPGRRRLG